MVRLESLKKSNQFKRVLKQKKLHTDNFSLFAAKNFYQPKNRSDLLISFVMKKKIGNAVKRNRIKRKLKGVVQKMLKVSNSINLNYIYIIFGKEKIYSEHSNSLFKSMEQSFKKINKE